mmetsp:Transcript_39650/g.82980  ORF Transcript_39650/g.82980 Transcript_39650/m.82980 type:complete len:147 (-) Transcript_39650:453-893(-)
MALDKGGKVAATRPLVKRLRAVARLRAFALMRRGNTSAASNQQIGPIPSEKNAKKQQTDIIASHMCPVRSPSESNSKQTDMADVLRMSIGRRPTLSKKHADTTMKSVLTTPITIVALKSPCVVVATPASRNICGEYSTTLSIPLSC